MKLAACVVALAGCGRIGFDATADAGRAGDAADAANLGSGPWSTPTVIVATTTGSDEEEASFTLDRLELYYRSTFGVGDSNLYVSRRASITDPWGVPSLITELNTTDDDLNPAISADGLTLWFSSDRPPSMSYDLWVSTRPDRTAQWSPPVAITSLNTIDEDVCPRADVTGLWFNRRNTADSEIWHATGTGPANWTSPQPVPDLNGAYRDTCPKTWAGGLRVVFGSNRADTMTSDLWEASRNALTEPFGNIAPISDLNLPGVDDWDIWISEDGHYAVFGSNRGGDHDLYEVFR